MGTTILYILVFVCFVVFFIRSHFKQEKEEQKKRDERDIRYYYHSQKTILFILIHIVKEYGYDAEVENIIKAIENNKKLSDTVSASLKKKIEQISHYYEITHNDTYIDIRGYPEGVSYNNQSFDFYVLANGYPKTE